MKVKSDENQNIIKKDILPETLKKIQNCIIMAIGIMLYFVILNLAYTNMKLDRLIGDIEVFAGGFLVIGIYFLEKSYKNDKGSLAILAIEFLVLSIHSLTIMNVIKMLKYDFRLYLLTSSYVFAIYYILKSIVFYTKDRREYAKSLSDISEIVKKDEPKKKEAKKRQGESDISEKENENNYEQTVQENANDKKKTDKGNTDKENKKKDNKVKKGKDKESKKKDKDKESKKKDKDTESKKKDKDKESKKKDKDTESKKKDKVIESKEKDKKLKKQK